MNKLTWQKLATLSVGVLLLVAGFMVGSFYRGANSGAVQNQLETATAEVDRYKAKNGNLAREAEDVRGRLQDLEAQNTALLAAGRMAVQASLGTLAVARRETCISGATIRHQRRIVRQTINPVVKGMRAVQLRRIAGVGAGWFPLAGDIVDSAVTGAALIQDRNQEFALRRLDSSLDQASTLARRDCQRRGVFSTQRRRVGA